MIRPVISLLLLSTLLAHGRMPSPDFLPEGNDATQSSADGFPLSNGVFIFDPEFPMAAIQATIDSIFELQYRDEFSKNRIALLFKPGHYNLDIKVGYYTQVTGLGSTPEEVVIRGSVRSISKREGGGHVLTNFWRAVENLTIIPATDSTNVWGVSQAAPMRRVIVKGNLQLHDNGYASGGFLADSRIEGAVKAGGQQQWFSRNCDWNRWEGGAWNILSMGVENAPEDNWPKGPYTTLDSVPVSREKPYMVWSNGQYLLKIPASRVNSKGLSWENGGEMAQSLPLGSFYLAEEGKDNAASINRALKEGRNVIFAPGRFDLEESLVVNQPGTLLIGIGMPSLMPKYGNPAIRVEAVEGVILSGLLIDAGPILSETLLQVGSPNVKSGNAQHPTWLFDLFFRVGGPFKGAAVTCLEINSSHLFADHLWLWRADHGNGVGWDLNRSDHGLVVNGDQVTVYGLFNEHHQKYQTRWNGEGGRVFLYQSELPYDPPAVESWKHNGTGGYASYKVSEGVSTHEAWCVGVYCVFYDAPIVVDRAIETPVQLERDIHRKFTFWLNGYENSIIKSIINGKGEAVHEGNRNADLL